MCEKSNLILSFVGNFPDYLKLISFFYLELGSHNLKKENYFCNVNVPEISYIQGNTE